MNKLLNTIILSTLMLSTGCSSMFVNKERAERNAKTWLKETYGVKGNASCSGKDSDGDTYVRCTVVDPETKKKYALECVA